MENTPFLSAVFCRADLTNGGSANAPPHNTILLKGLIFRET